MDAERSTTTPTATIADRYVLRGMIGRGGMGEVYAAWDQQLQREVALKRLRGDVAHHPAMRKRVEAEARAAAQVIHPNVVTVFDSGVDGGHPFIVMELLEGRSLADELERGPMRVEAVSTMARQVLDGLGAAHRIGLIHRDVKPSNVLSTAHGAWKVADFGIAKVAGSDLTLTATNDVLGSPAYMAPERVTGEPATVQSDLYSVGVLMYEALAGRRPFDDEHPVAVAMRVREGTHEALTSLLPDALRPFGELVERAMASDPGDRFGSAQEMADAVTRHTNEVDVEFGGTQPIDRTPTQRMEPTEATLPLPRVADPKSGTEALPSRAPVDTPTPPAEDASLDHVDGRRWPPRAVLGAVLIAAVLTIGVLTIAVFALLPGNEPPPVRPDRTVSSAAPPSADVPVPLQDALDRLEEAVSP
jgi:serine/threonine protein kinase